MVTWESSLHTRYSPSQFPLSLSDFGKIHLTSTKSQLLQCLEQTGSQSHAPSAYTTAQSWMMPSSFTAHAYPCLQLCSSASRHFGFGRTNEPVAVGSERCRPSPSATLGTSTPARLLQGRDARSLVADWHFAADDCCLVTDALERQIRSTASWTCVVTRTYSTFGERAFAAAGPGL